MIELRMAWHRFRQWVWERRRKSHHADMITAKIIRDIHREAWASLRQRSELSEKIQ